MSGFWRRSLDQLYHSLTDDVNVVEQVHGRGARAVLHLQGHRGRPPRVGREVARAEERVVVPGPARRVGRERRDMEAQEAAAAPHVRLETGALGGRLRKIVQEQDDLVGVDPTVGEQVPVGAGRVGEAVVRRLLREPGVRLLVEVDVRRVVGAAVQGEDLERGRGGAGLRDGRYGREAQQRGQQEQDAQQRAHGAAGSNGVHLVADPFLVVASRAVHPVYRAKMLVNCQLL